jgi:rhomboid protease GluP
MELPAKFWFKLQRLKQAWNSMFHTNGESYDTSHRMCPNCRALIDRSAKVCPLCGVETGPLRAHSRPSSEPGKVLGVIPVPRTATAILVAVIMVMYGVEWYMTQTVAGASAGPSWGGISAGVMLRLGGKFGPLMYAGQWWRLITAMFLHASLLHIGFNLWCLFDLGPEVEILFGTQKFLVMYLATGVLGFVASLWWNPWTLSIGASGAILGLIGVLIGTSFHHGSLGKDYRSTLWRWVIYIFIFGLFFSVDNAAHLGGLISGLALGYLIPSGEPATRAEQQLWDGLSIVSVLLIVGSFALMALQLNRPM